MCTVAVLNATLDLAALVLVGVAAFFGSEVVLGSLHVEVSVGWCGRLLGLWSGLGSLWLPSCAMWQKKMSAWPFTVAVERLGKGLANGLDAYARPPRSLREPTRWNQDKSPETIYHIRISLYASYARQCVDKLVDNLHIPSHLEMWMNICLLCLRNSAYATKIYHCFRGCLRTPPRTVKYQVVSLRDFIRSSLEYIMPCIQKKTMLKWPSSDILHRRLL